MAVESYIDQFSSQHNSGVIKNHCRAFVRSATEFASKRLNTRHSLDFKSSIHNKKKIVVCSQSYKCFMIVNYNCRVIHRYLPIRNFPVSVSIYNIGHTVYLSA